MSARLASYLPFGIAVVLPLAGLILGIFRIVQGDTELGIRIILISLLATVVWTLLFLG